MFSIVKFKNNKKYNVKANKFVIPFLTVNLIYQSVIIYEQIGIRIMNKFGGITVA
jgi:hypothetical protein